MIILEKEQKKKKKNTFTSNKNCFAYSVHSNHIVNEPNSMIMQRTSMTEAEILPKFPCELRSNFQMMRRVLKLVYIVNR